MRLATSEIGTFDMPTATRDVRFQGYPRRHMLAPSSSQFDPQAHKSTARPDRHRARGAGPY